MKRALAFVIIQIVLRPLQWLPLSALHELGAILGKVMLKYPSKKHAIVKKNLALAFPEITATEQDKMHERSVKHMACFALETGKVWHASDHQLSELVVRIKGWEHIENALASDKGLLLVGAHLGNWEILNLYCMQRLDMAGLYRAPRDPVINQWVRKARERFGGELIPSGSQSMRQLLKNLKSGGVAGIIADQQPRLGDGVMAPFFGEPALTMTLIGRLARRTNCHVLMASCYRCLKTGFEIDITPMDDSIRSEDPIESAKALNSAIESAVRQHPDQYLWRYQRFPASHYSGS